MFKAIFGSKIEKNIKKLSSADSLVRRDAAWDLAYLACNNSTNQAAIREAHGIAPLVARVKDADAVTRQNAAGALWYLAMNNPSTQAEIIDCGGLPKLAELAITDENARKTIEACQALQSARQQPVKASATASTSTLSPTKDTSSNLSATSSKDEEIASLRRQLAEARLSAPNLAYAPTIASSALTIDYSKKLGEGGFGVVYQAQWQTVAVAAKMLKITNLSPKALADFQEEAQRHGLLRHPNIVMLFGVCVEPGHYAMVMEFMTSGSLNNLLHSTQDIPWSLRQSIAQNIASGLYYLHNNRIIHRDLKSLNVLLDEHKQAKLADFGLSTIKLETQTRTTTAQAKQAAGTVRWMAPELFKRGGASCNEGTDIYALGWVLWEIAARQVPFESDVHADNDLIKDWIKDGERDTIPASTPPQYAALLTKCWQQRAEDRPADVKQVVDELAGMALTEAASLASGYQYFST